VKDIKKASNGLRPGALFASKSSLAHIDSTLLFQIFVVTQTLTLSETATGPTSSGNQDFVF